ncbi:Gastrula zinc finger protein xFG20-1 [Araneus ventricosus]|uniref:Gastrula zinc finger protein xFG20-1 n=1 Tax=Araneus ventricosus TaxID=182803 RepID=A0A4Y2IVT4_ARAVE|nr:Gastrula zinc finger protein xFG20-1 [Araneus ventricosus]
MGAFYSVFRRIVFVFVLKEHADNKNDRPCVYYECKNACDTKAKESQSRRFKIDKGTKIYDISNKGRYLRFKCTVCEKLFDSSYKLRVHMRYHTDERPYVCENCGLAVHTNSALNQHKRTMHNMDKPFLCVGCGMKFNRKGNLKSRMEINKGITPLECTPCPREFTLLYEVESHRMSQLKMELLCDVCGEKFNCKRALQSHELAHDHDAD